MARLKGITRVHGVCFEQRYRVRRPLGILGVPLTRSFALTFLMACSVGWAQSAGAPQSNAVPRSKQVMADGLRFPTLAWGRPEGRPVLLLHGFPENARTWAYIAEGLAAAGYFVVSFDQRGYAATTRPRDQTAYNFDLFVSDALAIADAYHFKRFNVAGLGMGGAQGWILAARFPERVRSLVVLRFPHPAAFAAGIRDDSAQAESWAKLKKEIGAQSANDQAAQLLKDNAAGLRAFLAKSGLPQPWLDRYVRRLQEPGALAGALSWEHAISLDEFAAVPAVRVPTEYVWSVGPALTETTARATASHVTGKYRIEELRGAGNFILETSSERLLPLMLQFYRETNND